MDKYIVALLNNNLRVIIPDFGAFIIKQKEPKIVVFNEYLKHDDGLLIDFMMKTEAVDKGIAMQQLSDFLADAAKAFEAKKIFIIAGLGTLRKDFNGRILFSAEEETGKPDLTNIVEGETIIQLEEEHAPAKLTTKTASKAGLKSTHKATGRKAKEPASKASKSKIAAAVKKTEKTEKKAEPLPGKTIQEKTEPIGKPAPAMSGPTEVDTATKVQPISSGIIAHETISDIAGEPAETANNSSRYSSRQIIRWLLIILLANTIIIAFFVFRNNIRNMLKPKKQTFLVTDSLFNQLSDSVRVAAADTTFVFREIADAVVTDKDSVPDGDLRYYIVAGCFRDEINADELVKSLKELGFKAEKFGQIGNLFAVSFVSFDDKELAVKELKRIREEIHPEAWMTRF
jgi:hypothetical protein